MSLQLTVQMTEDPQMRQLVRAAAYAGVLNMSTALQDTTAEGQEALRLAIRAVTENDQTFLDAMTWAVASAPAVVHAYMAGGYDVRKIPDAVIGEALTNAWQFYAAANVKVATTSPTIPTGSVPSPSPSNPTPMPGDAPSPAPTPAPTPDPPPAPTPAPDPEGDPEAPTPAPAPPADPAGG